MEICKEESKQDINVKFLDEFGFIKHHTTYENFKRGQIKNPYDRSIRGIGYLGVGKYMAKIDGKPTDEYNSWATILDRCYSNKEKYPAYYGICTMCEEWMNFQTFADWYNEHKFYLDERLHIDKDIKFPGNKVYSPNTCMLVPQRINMLFLNKPNHRGLPNGISKTKNGYEARYSELSIGVYNSLNEAYMHYATQKESVIKNIALEYKNIIPKELFDVLMKYKVRIEYDQNYKSA